MGTGEMKSFSDLEVAVSRHDVEMAIAAKCAE